jgi:hypothetical protein
MWSLLDNFLDEMKEIKTDVKIVDPNIGALITTEEEYGDSRQYDYRPLRFDNEEMRRINLFGILRGIISYSDDIINKTVETVFELIKLGINQRGKLRFALYAICLNKHLNPVLSNTELLKLFKIKSVYLSTVQKNIEKVVVVEFDYVSKYLDLFAIDQKNKSIIETNLLKIKTVHNSKNTTKIVAMVYHLFLNDRKLVDVCKIAKIGKGSISTYLKVIQLQIVL